MGFHPVIDYKAISNWDELQYEFGVSKNFQIHGTWQYRGEGNSNIVLALAEGMRLVRFPKVEIDQNFSGEWDRERKKLKREVIFAHLIFRPLIGSTFVGNVEILQIDSCEISELNKSLVPLRPVNRLHKELRVPYATSHADFARIHSNPSTNVDYCVEIKPKQGYLTKTIFGEETHLCTFCLNQFLKIRSSKVSSRSDYCPLNLFSGDPGRMIGALFSLLHTPQNNFRIFRNGELVYGEDLCESLDSILEEWFSSSHKLIDDVTSPQIVNLYNFVFVMCVALLKPEIGANEIDGSQLYAELEGKVREILVLGVKNEVPIVTDGNKNEGCNENSVGLPNGSILSRILYVQKLGKWGSENIYNLYPKICPRHSILSKSNSLAVCPGKDCLGEEKWLDEVELTLSELGSLCIQNYLLAATAKDCSIMICFSSTLEETRDSGEVIQDLSGCTYDLKIGVADLDPKPFTAVAKHFMRDVEMWEAYRRLRK